jgi:hypothetical protein
MDCRKVHEWLLQSDLADAEAAPPDVAAHLGGCPECRRLADRLRRLERAVREMPAPPGADEARVRFLRGGEAPLDLPDRRVPQVAGNPRSGLGGTFRQRGLQAGRGTLRGRLIRYGAEAARSIRAIRRWRAAPWVASGAAAVLLAAGIGLLILWSSAGQTAEASAALDRMVDWNIEMAEAGSLDARGRLYAAAAGKLGRQAQEGKWSAEEQELAGGLLENGARLARNADPLTDAEGFTDVAAVLVRHMGAAASKRDGRAMQRLGRYYARVIQSGVNAKVARIASGGPAVAEHDRQLEKLLRRHAELRAQLAQILENAPDASRKEIRRALDLPPPRHHGNGK